MKVVLHIYLGVLLTIYSLIPEKDTESERLHDGLKVTKQDLCLRTSLVDQWLRTCLPVQGTWV